MDRRSFCGAIGASIICQTTAVALGVEQEVPNSSGAKPPKLVAPPQDAVAIAIITFMTVDFRFHRTGPKDFRLVQPLPIIVCCRNGSA